MLIKHPVGHTVLVRITLVHYSLPPVVGGVEHVVSQHASLFAAQGHEVTLISGTPEGAGEAGILRICLPELAARAIPEAGPVTEAFEEEVRGLEDRLRATLEGEELVILHNLLTMPFNLPATVALHRLASGLQDIQFISWIHDIAAINPDYEIPRGYPWDYLRLADPLFRHVVISPIRQEQWCALTDLSPADCPLVPNGLSISEVLELSPALAEFCESRDLFEKDLVLLHPTRLLRRKNVELSLEIAAALKAAGLQVALLITAAEDPHHAPSAEYARQLRARSESLGLTEDVVFLGELWAVTPQNIAGLYRVADAVLFPSRQEGFGLPMIEAALHRLPCFCSDIEPLRSLPGAIPFPLDADPDAIAGIIIRQMQQWPANSPRKDVVRNYAWPAIYRKYLAPLLQESNNRN